MEQVVVNLLNNAAKYTDPGGLFRMIMCREGEDAVVRIRGNGVGIAPEQLPKIFELFAQVDGSFGRIYGGLGIGLALSRSLMEMQGGWLVASSSGLDKGSEFTVKLPLIISAVDLEAETRLEPGENLGTSLQVLLVEDNVDAADSLSMLLRLYGHKVQVARSGPSALEMAAATLPDVVLLDIGLPGMDGYQVAERLRERPEFKKVVLCALTGYTPSDSDRARHQEVGFDHYFVKPLEPDHAPRTVPDDPSAGSVKKPDQRRRWCQTRRTRPVMRITMARAAETSITIAQARPRSRAFAGRP